jgi:RiboL-PSP-HEPN
MRYHEGNVLQSQANREGLRALPRNAMECEFFRSGLSQKSNLPYKDGIRTQGNLSSDVLKEIIDSLGLDFSPFEAKSNLIDDILLRSRNTIAHGEYLQMTEERYEELSRDVLEMMENFRTQVQNAAILHAFQANANQL